MTSTPSQDPTSTKDVLMSPNTRKRNSRLAEDVINFIKDSLISKNDELDVVTLAMKRLGLFYQICLVSKPSKSGRKLTPLATRQLVWTFWNKNRIPSTISSRPAKMYTNKSPKIQTGLDFVDTIRIIKQRNRTYESQCFVINETLKVLHHKFVQLNPETVVSYGSFLALKPFYVRSATTKDVEMCCCKKQLPMCWSVKALIDCTTKQNICLGRINNYSSFFEHLTEDCEKEESTYISWNCPVDNTLCVMTLRITGSISKRE